MLVYILGKISSFGIMPEDKEKYAEAEHWLNEKGHRVINPASDEYQNTLNQATIKVYNTDSALYGLALGKYYPLALVHGIISIIIADAVAILPDCGSSKGSIAQYCFAKAIEKTCFLIKFTHN